ncbi:MAG: NAD(P)/FAD-dependent oxidoreductase [Flavobacteriales bacterium]|nr:NAD(P)/FAD-dependent oxidoreductase [Flavobacteriales bacterium]HQV37812.1 NAD(P)/FAD-dependent oxidoreductase [Flavobacteriales bacterium]HQW31564.1 NAD(P)/FAD-dependent oxidoreductase [Flavobacteriales bacterium]HQY01589.1 NAD(P)/FAD-dependent oxidoreductase [Flavobacteriales bacterium]HQY79117.1 NAD(P)/FAD-dependent oxidoreductase [Flavobacteriales bacterium]
MRVIVVGGGAAGFFAAISAKQHHPSADVLLLEKSNKLLAKVRVSGGGRCNVTHDQPNIRKLSAHYPRGERFLRKVYEYFSVKDTIAWFAQRGVQLKTEADGRMFPISDDSGTIIRCLMDEAEEQGVRIALQSGVGAIDNATNGFKLCMESGGELQADHVIVTTGGHPKAEGYAWLKQLGHTIVQPVPSLFTFNMPGEAIRSLMGVVADPVRARIIGTKLESTGPLLITHWGMSGPAVLRLSAWGARVVQGMGYRFTLQLHWLGGMGEEDVRNAMAQEDHRRKQAQNANHFPLPRRLWEFLLAKAEIPLEKPWGDVGKKDRNRLVDLLTNDRYAVAGKTTFKEEFVTAGGVALEEVDPHTLQSRKVQGLYFAGEVLNIDGITGGFNFQAAWTTGYLAGRLVR